ncbi:hypothetical protein [Prevotella nigrescens]|uniref:hypothetical protein n=1 Tax=Prevotella nigrescens TaxID=28133 RepID=UPI00021820D6|nr:hypothetical protein [Prevotella nigrescens]EGQ13868.1 hypothetical protein HMPREF9419_1485 [Prevotella nigrescens ATCC 33563]UAK28538.1 hypothetical protein K8O81_00465 [Prevotella nigrescens]WMS22357.1 hypothetical protein RDV52_04120 [Prevotella nigrescens]SUB93222.1 Uncharacterised protein [Prevotella nigrescens]
MDRNNTTNILLKGIVILIVPAIAIVALGKIGLTEAQAILIVGVFTVITAANQIRASNKKTFINTITIARKEYIATLRKVVSEFCASAESKDNNNTRLIELSYHLKMFMNPNGKPNDNSNNKPDDTTNGKTENTDGYWDREAIKLIDEIIQAAQTEQTEDKKRHISKFIRLMQLWFALEWHGMTEESKHGIMDDDDKKNLQKKYYLEYKTWVKQEYNE